MQTEQHADTNRIRQVAGLAAIAMVGPLLMGDVRNAAELAYNRTLEKNDDRILFEQLPTEEQDGIVRTAVDALSQPGNVASAEYSSAIARLGAEGQRGFTDRLVNELRANSRWDEDLYVSGLTATREDSSIWVGTPTPPPPVE